MHHISQRQSSKENANITPEYQQMTNKHTRCLLPGIQHADLRVNVRAFQPCKVVVIQITMPTDCELVRIFDRLWLRKIDPDVWKEPSAHCKFHGQWLELAVFEVLSFHLRFALLVHFVDEANPSAEKVSVPVAKIFMPAQCQTHNG